jgi:menaquinone-dependent protoporphyrinogen oxidase
MTTRILVAYASMFGSTAQIAQVLGAALRDAHTVVDVRPVIDVNDVGPYHAVVIGSAIYNGQWLPDAVQFVHIHEATLCRLPVAYFAACMLLHRDTPRHRRAIATYLHAVRQLAPRVEPVTIGMFAGKLRYRNLPLLQRLLFAWESRMPWGDFRDWNAIRTWAQDLRPALLNHDGR